MQKRKLFLSLLLVVMIASLAVVFVACNNDPPAAPPDEYTVTFDSDGGSSVDAQTVKSGEKAVEPDDPSKDEYDFKGWFIGETKYDFDTPVTDDITLKAKWDPSTP
ncbi:MAG: InlB B-repeat-containing protein, partial [Clostridia bacterium]|nr:InlB B-repeat-containing protein [Clostridia bacterium]